VAVAGRLRTSLRPADTVAQLGGDEFAVLIEQRVEPPAQVAARLIDALAAPLTLAGTEVTVTVSIGLATAARVAEERLTADTLLRLADTAMYAAKGRGKDTWVVYDPRRHGNDDRVTLPPPGAGRRLTVTLTGQRRRGAAQVVRVPRQEGVALLRDAPITVPLLAAG
jgi:hypothetical protein